MTNYTIVHRPAFNIIGLKCRTSNAPEAAPHDISKLWQKFYAEETLARIPHKASHEVIALYCDYDGDYTQPYSLIIGCPVYSLDEVPAGMSAKAVPASSYALFRAVGEHPKSLIETWQAIWQAPLKRTYTGDFEIYNAQFAASPPVVEVCIAID